MKMSLLSLVVLALLTVSCDRLPQAAVQQAATLTSGGDARMGREEIRKYGCNTCHEISGIPGPRGLIGPPTLRLGGVRNEQWQTLNRNWSGVSSEANTERGATEGTGKAHLTIRVS